LQSPIATAHAGVSVQHGLSAAGGFYGFYRLGSAADEGYSLDIMDAEFLAHVAALKPKLEALLAMKPVKPSHLPSEMPKAGVYLLSDGAEYLYVGRSNDIRGRIGRHCRPGATHRMAAFAFRLARHATGRLDATYKTGEGSRAALVLEPVFKGAFMEAKARIREMELRFVEEADPVRQALLEVYVALAVKAKHNDFDNH